MASLSRIALAASALKLGGLAAFNAEASIIATVPSTPIVIQNNQLILDLDHDGTNDLGFFHVVQIGTDGQTDAGATAAANGPGVAGDPAGNYFTLPFTGGAVVDGAASYKSFTKLAKNKFDFSGSGSRIGNLGYWANGGAGIGSWPGAGQGYTGYLGFAFTGADTFTHYGWARVGVNAYTDGDPSSYAMTLYSYAYETQADTGIPAGVPEPGSLALFALGAAGLAARKRRALSAAA
jgi:hypothetical protein